MQWFVRMLGKIPLRVLYGLSSWWVYPLVYHVVRYRRALVAKNLRLSFPEMTDAAAVMTWIP